MCEEVPLIRFLFNSALVVWLLCASLAAQTTQTSPPKSGKIPAQKPGAKREITPQQEQAISAINNLFERTKEFVDDKTRVEAQGQIADALWQYDQKTARRQFTEAFRSIERIEDEVRSLAFLDDPKTSLRVGLLRLIAHHDADLAERLVLSTPEPSAKAKENAHAENQGARGKLYLNLAHGLISTDPNRAAELIQKGFSGGFGTELVMTLRLLGQIEPETADKLMRKALSEIPPDPETPMGDLFAILGMYFTPDHEDAAGRNADARKSDSPETPEFIRPSLVEPLLNFAFKAITIESENEQKRMSSGQKQKRMVMFDMIDEGIVAGLLPFFERHQPERAAFIRSRLGQIENALPPTVREAMNTPQPTTVKELLDEAQSKKDPFKKDMLYSEAARKAEEAGDFDQAIAITEKLSDKRWGMDVSSIRHSAVINASDKGDIDAAYRYAKAIPDLFDQSRALCRIALKSFEKKDLQRANELINEAEKMIAKSDPTSEKVFALLDVAAAATTINPVSGFEVVNSAVGVINQVYSAKSQSTRMYFIRDSETFEKSLGMLARADFQRAMRLALAITQSDVSALAQLAVCRGVLVEPKKQPEVSGEKEKNPVRK
jgi:hypothetical protein